MSLKRFDQKLKVFYSFPRPILNKNDIVYEYSVCMLGMTENNSPLRSFIVFVPPRCQVPTHISVFCPRRK